MNIATIRYRIAVLLAALALAGPLHAQWSLVASDAAVKIDGLPVLRGEVFADGGDRTQLLPATEILSTGAIQDTAVAGLAADRLSGEHVFLAVTTPTGDGSLPGDVLRCAVDGSGCTSAFSATGLGIPDGVGVSAVGVEVEASDQRLLLSFDTSFELDGQVYRPGDVAQIDQGALAIALSHADLGVAPHLSVAGVSRRPDGSWQAAFEHGAEIDGTAFFSSDVLGFASAGTLTGFETRLRSVDLSWQQAGVAGWDALDTGCSGFVGLAPAINPGDDQVVLEVDRADGGEARIAIDYQTVEGTASAGTDYQAASGTLVWAHGETGSRQIVIDLIDAGSASDQREFTVALAPASPWALTGGRDALTLEIADQDALFRDSFEN